jgi:hypothetical protein
MADDRAQARREAAVLLGVDIEHLSAADGLRIDMVAALRLVIDSEQASILSGGSADLGKLNVAVQSLIALLPNRELPEPTPAEGGPDDPRTIMFETYMAMRKRGEIADPMSTFEGRAREVERLRARVAELEAAGGAPAPEEPGASSGANAPVGGNVVPLPGAKRKHVSDLPPASASAPAAPPPPAAASAPVAGELVMVVDPSSEEPWRDYVEPTGEIRSTPRVPGRYWGPV